MFNKKLNGKITREHLYKMINIYKMVLKCRIKFNNVKSVRDFYQNLKLL